jgi:phosphohistidine phosphatase SixA
MPALLVRHAKAGSRKDWPGDDRLRPLSKAGHRQADALVAVLTDYPVTRVLSSPYTRCVQSVEPLAVKLGLEVEARPELAEGVNLEDPMRLLRELAHTTAVYCSHGDIIPALLDSLIEEDALRLHGPDRWPKASTWVLEALGDRYVSGLYVPPPE